MHCVADDCSVAVPACSTGLTLSFSFSSFFHFGNWEQAEVWVLKKKKIERST